MTIYNQFVIFIQLFKRSLYTFRQHMFAKIRNSLIWSSITVFVFHFIMPHMGLKDYGLFMLVTGSVTWGLFAVMHNVAYIVSDILGDNALSYELTLPIPQWLVFIKIALANSFQSFLSTLLIVPFSSLLLGFSFDYTYFSIPKFIFMLILANLFYGAFSLFLASITTNLYKIDNIWLRVIFPMFYLGGFDFSWKILHKTAPMLSYLSFCNPLMYILEGTRAATLNPELSLPYWLCCVATICFTFIAGYIGIKHFRRRLDCL